MACDGKIAEEETLLLRKLITSSNLFKGLETESLLNEFVNLINTNGLMFLNDYLKELKDASLDDNEALEVIDIAFQTIEADKKIQYSEISFFKRMRKRLRISDKKIEDAYPNKINLDDYLLPDIAVEEQNWSVKFNHINLNIN